MIRYFGLADRYLRRTPATPLVGQVEGMTILLNDERVGRVPLVECGEPMVVLPGGAWVRESVAGRLGEAAAALPTGVHLRIQEGHRDPMAQQNIIDRYTAEVCAAHPGIGPSELDRLVSRFVSPLAVAPHVAGAAVDLTLTDGEGDLDLGTTIDATPEASGGKCFSDSPDISPEARSNRAILFAAMRAGGFVNYPTEWWHWSIGDRYWALLTGSPAAIYGPVGVPALVGR